MIKALVFDMDGILFDTERLTVGLWGEVSKTLGCTDVTPFIADYMGLNSVSHKQYFFHKFGDDFPYDEFLERGRIAVAQHIEKNGVPLKSGLFELLDYLKANGYGIAAATSTRRVTALRLFESAKIIRYFDHIICGDMLEKSKPDPEIYLKAAGALGVEPALCMALEDSPNGIRSAYRAGMKTVMVPDLIPPSPELDKMLFACVPSLNEVIPLLK